MKLLSPWRPPDALRLVSVPVASPGFELLAATGRHVAVLARTGSELSGLLGDVVHDLRLAVLICERGGRCIGTRGAGFHRFPFLAVAEPLDELRGSR